MVTVWILIVLWMASGGFCVWQGSQSDATLDQVMMKPVGYGLMGFALTMLCFWWMAAAIISAIREEKIR